MSQTKNEGNRLKRLLDFASDAELTDAEIRSELEADGVDVEAFTMHVVARIAAKRKEKRLAWRTAAREKAAAFSRQVSTDKYASLSRAALLDLARSRPLPAVGFRNFEELGDEDLRSLLADSDLLDPDES